MRFFRFIAVLIVVFGLFTGCEERPVAVVKAPQFELKDTLGKPHKLEEFRGNVVLLHFWASWCPPCLDELPRWLEIASRGGSDLKAAVKLVAISADTDFNELIKIFPKEKVSANVVSLWDPSNKVAGQFGTRQFPETYLLNQNLEIVEKWVGSQEWNSPRMRFELEKAIVLARRK